MCSFIIHSVKNMNPTDSEEGISELPVAVDFYTNGFFKESNNNPHSSSPSSEMASKNITILETEAVDEKVRELTTPDIDTIENETKAIIPRYKQRRKKQLSYAKDPTTRKMHKRRLLSQLRNTVNELAVRAGQQVVVIIATPENVLAEYRVFGAKPLEGILRKMQYAVLKELKKAMTVSPVETIEDLFALPALNVDGTPTPLEKMNQAQLRSFIPYMMKFSTGRSKPGWGVPHKRPPWWPKDVPYQNVRTDVRSLKEKKIRPWTSVLRQLVYECYRYHNREDLLQCGTQTQKKTKQSKPNPDNSSTETNDNYVIHLQPVAEATVTEDTQIFLVDKDGSEYPVSVSRMYNMPVYEMNTESSVSNSDGEICVSTMDSEMSITEVEDNVAQHQVLIEGYGNDLPQILEIISVTDDGLCK